MFVLAAALLPLWQGCGLIDEDLSVCYNEYELHYQLRLVTNMELELETVLSLQEDEQVESALRPCLATIFRDLAHDVDLSFYGLDEPMERRKHQVDEIDDDQASYNLILEADRYMHLSLANLQDNTHVRLQGDEKAATSTLVQTDTKADAPVVGNHETGIFSARLPMDVRSGESQTFNVSLYMVNCASALVLERADGGAVKSLKAYATGFADSFAVADSLYHYPDVPALVEAEELDVEGDRKDCFMTVAFPSKDDRPVGKVVITTDEPFKSDGVDGSLWEYRVYATLADGKVTETILGIRTPLRAGQFKLLRATVMDDGSVVPSAGAQVGASVTLDWQSAGNYDIEL